MECNNLWIFVKEYVFDIMPSLTLFRLFAEIIPIISFIAKCRLSRVLFPGQFSFDLPVLPRFQFLIHLITQVLLIFCIIKEIYSSLTVH